MKIYGKLSHCIGLQWTIKSRMLILINLCPAILFIDFRSVFKYAFGNRRYAIDRALHYHTTISNRDKLNDKSNKKSPNAHLRFTKSVHLLKKRLDDSFGT